MSLAIALLVGSAAAAQATNCPRDPALEYVCAPVKPEDLLSLPGTPWLIASGFAQGSGIKLVDTRTRQVTPWFDGRRNWLRPASMAFPQCPGPVSPADFNARGLSLRETGVGRWQLLVVNHGGRESIEVFEVRSRGTAAPGLRWRGCIPMPLGQVANSVASYADGTILTTVLTRPGTTIADFVEGRVTGGVWQWKPGQSGFELLPGTELPGNNGLEVDPDQRRFYVVAFGLRSVLTFDRFRTRTPLARTEARDFMPDNIHWSSGRLLLAGMRLDEPACGGRRKVIDGVADPMLCHRGSIVAEMDPAKQTITTVAEFEPQPNFNGVSAAAIANGRLWLGSFQASRIAVASLPKERPRDD
ncbi:MAG: hypothetical protein K2Y17_12440 [Qipengyuania sp.]|nr:hypothetical protein [Qipengyuania sp.]